jgi:transcriptional regulator with XRE-family HTH domain
MASKKRPGRPSVESKTELGKWLQVARKKAGLTQLEVSAKVGITPGHIAKLERGEAGGVPLISTLEALAELFGVSFQKLKLLVDKDRRSVSDSTAPEAM